MEFRILGPVEVVDDGRVVALGPSKQRAVLAILLLHLNEVVSRDRLVEDIWGERAPETAATALHGYVSQLRKLLPGDGAERGVLITRAPGYLLKLDPEQVDLNRFELLASRGKRELAAGEAEAAASTLADALSLWRGPPLAEFDSAPFALAESLRLQELHVSTLEERIDADLAVGRHGDVIAELETLVRQHPLRERLRGQLMVALYRCGRQADALAAYQEGRRTLVDELGLEPGLELKQLEKQVLTHDPALEAPRRRTQPRTRRQGTLSRLPRWGIAAACAALTLAVVVGLALGRGEKRSMQLAPNSVGFVDAASGRITRSFAVGRDPRALTLAFGSVWVANYQDTFVTRIDRATGQSATIPVGGHPTAIAGTGKDVWVWTLEGLLVPIDPRFDSAGEPIPLQAQAPSGRVLGGIAVCGGFLWVTAPPTTLIRLDLEHPSRHLALIPDAGAEGPIVCRGDEAWIAGSDQVFPIDAHTDIAGVGIPVGTAGALAFAGGDLWLVSGGPGHLGEVVQAVRRIDVESRLVKATIPGGNEPIAIAAVGDSLWVASGSDKTLMRIDPAQNRVVQSTKVGASPTAVAADKTGLWIAVE
jgi:DNA-binding SARP family transcriptional activator/DNA-binding beta-propeller fold protein YncE